MRSVMLLSCALLVGCGGHPGAHKNSGNDMSSTGVVASANFDRCAPDHTGGFDPVAAKLPGCCASGGAHCVPSRVVPAALVPSLSSCSGDGVCLPDTFIRAGADFTPKPCASSLAQRPAQLAGVCLSRCLARVSS